MKLSIITINFNNFAGLKKTIESVQLQNCRAFEHIVVDGGSNDGSKEYIEQHSDKFACWLSEKDEGPYDAMNKGLRKAVGEYVFFLNSGDVIFNADTISDFVEHLDGTQMVYGNLAICENQKIWIKRFPCNLNFSFFFDDSLPHSGGLFLQRSAFVGELSEYDISLKIVADWKWALVALFKYGYTYKAINKEAGIFEYGNGISSRLSNRDLLRHEKEKVFAEEFKYLYPEMFRLNSFYIQYHEYVKSSFFKGAYELFKFTRKL